MLNSWILNDICELLYNCGGARRIYSISMLASSNAFDGKYELQHSMFRIFHNYTSHSLCLHLREFIFFHSKMVRSIIFLFACSLSSEVFPSLPATRTRIIMIIIANLPQLVRIEINDSQPLLLYFQNRTMMMMIIL